MRMTMTLTVKNTISVLSGRFLCLAALFLAVSCGGNAEPETPDEDPVIPGKIERVSIYSPELNKQLVTTVWLPAGYDENKTYPFLYLLHGYGDDNDSWIQKGGASNIADNYIHEKGVPMVIVMPNGLTSFYTGAFESYMHETLMPEVEKKFHCNGKRAVAGLSMGGYGSLYHALKYPSKFKYAYAMSPASDEAGFTALASAHDPLDYPPITVESGTQDYTVRIEGVRSMVSALRGCGLNVDFIERDGGHDWNFWPVCLRKALVKIGETFNK